MIQFERTSKLRGSRGANGFRKICGIALLALVPRQAFAEPLTYSLSWARQPGAESCPGAAMLRDEVTRRLGRDPFSDHAKLSLEAVVGRDREIWTVDIQVRDHDGSSLGQRAFQSEATACGAIFSATALALALVVDPEAASNPPSEGIYPEPSIEDSPSDIELRPPSSAEFAQIPTTSPETPPALNIVDTPPAPAVSPERDTAAYFAASGIGATGLLPAPAFGYQVAGGARWDAVGFELGLYALNGERTSDDVFGVGLTSGRGALTLQAATQGSLSLHATLGLSGGAMHVVVYEFTPRDTGDQFWLAIDPGLSVDFIAGRANGSAARIQGALRVHLSLRAVFPVAYPELVVEGAPEVAFTPPLVGGLLDLGLGMAFF